MSEDKVLNLLEKMYIEFNGKFEKIDQRFEKIDQRFEKIDQRFDGLEHRIEKLELKVENDISKKIEVLFDGQKQMFAQLNRIEEKVDQHDEIIIKRIK